MRDAATILDDGNIQLKVGNDEFGKRPDFLTLKVHYHYIYECKRDHKKEITKINSSNIESKVKIGAS